MGSNIYNVKINYICTFIYFMLFLNFSHKLYSKLCVIFIMDSLYVYKWQLELFGQLISSKILFNISSTFSLSLRS